MATRDDMTAPWVVDADPRYDASRLYRRAIRAIHENWFSGLTVPVLTSHFNRFDDFGGLRVEGLERFTEEGQQWLRLRLSESGPNGRGPGRALTFEFSDDEFLTLRTVHSKGMEQEYRVIHDYDMRSGMPLMTGARRRETRNDGTGFNVDLSVVQRSFEPMPESEFLSARLLTGPVTHDRAIRAIAYGQPSTLWDWYWLPLALGVASVAGGCGLILLPPTLRWRRYGRAPVYTAPTP
jgi:hypothetical protein